LYGVANRYFDTTFERPPALTRPPSQAVHTWLQWSLASYFMMFYGPPNEDWILTEAELFGAGPMYLRVEELLSSGDESPPALPRVLAPCEEPKHDWNEAMMEWMLLQKERAAGEDSTDDDDDDDDDDESSSVFEDGTRLASSDPAAPSGDEVVDDVQADCGTRGHGEARR